MQSGFNKIAVMITSLDKHSAAFGIRRLEAWFVINNE
jgi:hypothetical protein